MEKSHLSTLVKYHYVVIVTYCRVLNHTVMPWGHCDHLLWAHNHPEREEILTWILGLGVLFKFVFE